MKRATFMLALLLTPVIAVASSTNTGTIVNAPNCHSLGLYSEPTLQNKLQTLTPGEVIAVLDDHSFGQQSLIQAGDHYGFVESACVQRAQNHTCDQTSVPLYARSIAQPTSNDNCPRTTATAPVRYGYIDCLPGATAVGLLASPEGVGATSATVTCGEKVTISEEYIDGEQHWDKLQTASGSVGYIRRSFISDVPVSVPQPRSVVSQPLYSQQLSTPMQQNAVPLPTTNCQESVSFAVMQGGQAYSAMPSFVQKWLGNGKHRAKHPGMCFSQSPNAHSRNFVIVFSNSASSFLGFYPTVRTSTSTSPVYGGGTITDNYGGMWNYTYSGNITTTTTYTQDVPYTDTSSTLYARAYSQDGMLVSNRWATITTRQGGDPYNSLGYNLGSALGAIHMKERLLESVLKDIH